MQLIDVSNENLMSLTDAARTLPGGPVHVSTLHRWRLKGVRGIRLATVLRGGNRFTSKEAIERFIDDRTANDGTVTTSSVSQHEKTIAHAEAELLRCGI